VHRARRGDLLIPLIVQRLVLATLATLAAHAAAVPPDSVAAGAHAAVATDQRLATLTGLRVLRSGGNAVDAAVAIGYTLAVTFPEAGNIGGGGFMLVRFANGASHFIDFRETAPAAATANMYLDARGNDVPERSIVGPLGAAIPGTVAGLEYARIHYGTRSRHALMRDAVAYARRGFRLSPGDARALDRDHALLTTYAATEEIFAPGGASPSAGTRLRQLALARTLEAIDARGAAAFYTGPVAREIVRSVRASGGIFTLADLRAYRVVDREPIRCTYRGRSIVTAPLPSSGGVTMCEILGMLAHDPARPPARDFANVHLEIEAERRAFADRNRELGDPAFVRSHVARLLDPAYLARLRASIAPVRATPSSAIDGGAVTIHEGHNTTNYAVIDAAGNAVDVTYTLNNSFGSGFVAGTTGVLLNDEMDDFTSKIGAPNMFGLVQGRANAIAPGKRPLSSMTPTIVVDRTGRAVLAAGAAGGPRIITTTLDIVRATIDFRQNLPVALAAPRMHMQWLPDVLYAEPETFDAVTRDRLRAAGYRLQVGWAESEANAIGVRPDGTRVGVHDPRGEAGSAAAF
jgi:gamma-glutamyltranspeptidase/glutathione hydrolase